ncbi:phosphodiester glycosidase family protein [Pedobacter hiemivivus]|uniref:Phosphodiester glycosidase family protein n=1 Tax=Pedobacter hiemivivus TaxID=2530454 RepID=A0A4R0MV83_9SPHI|nr:phosphodiester glycosidase family protein [Pedobacter hiemivivus]TCC91068.1 phosphodiester glycosidase family protein [Pedobacter hiemivivus]
MIKINVAILLLFCHFFIACKTKEGVENPENKTEQGVKKEIDVAKSLKEKTALIKTINAYTVNSLADGVREINLKYTNNKNQQMAIFLFEVNLKNKNIAIKPLMPNGGKSYGRQSVPVMMEKNVFEGYQILGATNGDFFDSVTGEPRGLVYINGEAIRPVILTGWAFFAIDKNGYPLISGSSLYSQYSASLLHALGGRQILVTGGQEIKQTDVTIEPRTGIGYTSDDIVYMLVADGREENYSNGLSFAEMGSLMKALDVKEAINIDGGGSSTFVVNTDKITVKNKPSDGTPRQVANGWAICVKK